MIPYTGFPCLQTPKASREASVQLPVFFHLAILREMLLVLLQVVSPGDTGRALKLLPLPPSCQKMMVSFDQPERQCLNLE